MINRNFLLVLGLILAAAVSPAANAAVSIKLDTFTDQTPATINLSATKYLMATVATGTQGGGTANDIVSTTVTVGGSVVAADIAEVCVDYNAAEVACVTNPNPLTGIAITLGGTQTGGAPLDYRVTLNPSASGKTIFLSVVGITAAGNLVDNIPLPQSTATRNIVGAATAPTIDPTPTKATIQPTSATLGGTMTSDGSDTATCGVTWGTTSGPGPYTFSDTAACTEGNPFTVNATSLSTGTTYYFRAYVTNSVDTVYSNEDSFTPVDAPSVTTIAATGVTTGPSGQATLGGNVSDDGGDALTDVGVYYHTAPGAEAGIKTSMTPPVLVPGDFSGDVTGLASGVYYFKAYATNTFDETIASNELSFTIKELPTLLADPTVTGILPTSATLGGTMTANGFDTVTCGVTWGTTSGSGPYTFSQAAACTEGNPFTIDTSTIAPLVTGTTYYFRSYATNSVGTVYSANEGSFKPVDKPQLTAAVDLPSVTDSQALLGGDITDDGGDPVIAVGIVWDTDADPRTGGTDWPMTVANPFSDTVTGLPSGTTIWFLAYATNGAGTTDSTVISFDTDPGAPTLVATPTVEAIGVVSGEATLGGELSADGGGTISDCGVEWGTTSQGSGPYTYSASFGICSVGVPFTVDATSLTNGTTYYFRSYATNESAIAYSANEGSFVPYTTPNVTTGAATSVAHNQATLAGTVTDDGGNAVTDCTVKWGTVPDTYTGSASFGVCSVGIEFTVDALSLDPGVTYYYRAFATNAAGEQAASNEEQFTTLIGPAVVTADPAADIQATSAILGGEVTDEGGPAGTVTARGIVWDTSTPPETGGTFVPMGSGLGTFSQTVGGLPTDELVYFRAYATNSTGTYYSTMQSFTPTSTAETQASNILFPTVARASLRITWTRGSLDGVIVVMRLASTGLTHPADGDDYTGNPDFSAPPPELVAGPGNFVVYKGPGSSVIVNGLTESTLYSVAIYEYAGTGVSTTYLQSPAEADQATSNIPMHNYDFAANCDECHKHSGFGVGGTGLKTVCQTCHNPSGLASAKLEFGYEETAETTGHPTPTKNPGIDFVDCGMCHEMHKLSTKNTTLSTNNVTSVTQHNKSFLRANVDKYVPGAATPAYLHTDTTDPADNPDRAVEGGTDATEDALIGEARGYCQVCHTLTDYHRSSSTVGPDQCHDGASNDSCGGTEVHCGICHAHNDNFGASGGGSCTGCHDPDGPSTKNITVMFDRLSKHIPGGSTAVTQEDCEVCHDQTGHPGDDLVGLLNADDGTILSQTTPGKATLDDGEIFADNCLSCHDSNGASSLPGSGDQTPTSPFTGAGAPPVIDATAWDNSSHDRPVAEVGTTAPMTCIGDGTNGCHGSGHGSEQNSLLAPAAGPTQSTTLFCYNCHDSDGPSTSNVHTQFNDTSTCGTNVDPCTPAAGTGGATINGRHDVGVVTCSNCHSPHSDTTAYAARLDPDDQTFIGDYSPTGVYNEDGHNFSYNLGATPNDPVNPQGLGSSGRIEPDYIKFCLTCHDGTTPSGVTMTTGMENIASAYVTDQHGSNSNNASLSKGYMKYPWNTAGGTGEVSEYAAINCTTCHGPHGSNNIFNLRESITVGGVQMTVGGWDDADKGIGNPRWPYSCAASDGGTFDVNECKTTYILPPMNGRNIDDVNGVQEYRYWGAWCSFCHQMEAHGEDEDGTCNQNHVHGKGNF